MGTALVRDPARATPRRPSDDPHHPQQTTPKKQVEDPKRLLCLHGGSPSQISRDALLEIARLREASATRDAVVKLSRRNADARPFEAGGELPLEFLAGKSQAGAFALASHTKKRPHNVVLGRLFDGRLLDCVELGVSALTPVEKFGGAAARVQSGNRPAVLFAGAGFDRDPALRTARSMLLDLLRGRQVSTLDLASLDRVVLALAPGGGGGAAEDGSGGAPAASSAPSTLVLRQYAIRLKKSGTPIPRVALVEIGPRLDFAVRRHRPAPPDLEREAMRQPPKPKAKKVRDEGVLCCCCTRRAPPAPADDSLHSKYSDTSCLRAVLLGGPSSLSTPMLPFSDGYACARAAAFFLFVAPPRPTRIPTQLTPSRNHHPTHTNPNNRSRTPRQPCWTAPSAASTCRASRRTSRSWRWPNPRD
jgi:ribosome production factor 2